MRPGNGWVMLSKGQQLSDEHHVMRYVPSSRLRRDGDDNVVGFFAAAFELRPEDDALSVNWVEYFSGDYPSQIELTVKSVRASKLKVGKNSAFGVAVVGSVKQLAQKSGKSIRVVFSPSDGNPSHTSIQKLPREELVLFEALATEAFTELVRNSDVP